MLTALNFKLFVEVSLNFFSSSIVVIASSCIFGRCGSCLFSFTLRASMLVFFAHLERIFIPVQAETRVQCAVGSPNCGMKSVGIIPLWILHCGI